MYINISNKKIARNRGFNIIELVISIAVLTIMLGVIGLFARNTFYYNSIFSGGLTAYDENWSIVPVWPGWVIETTLNESTNLHDLVIKYCQSDTVSEIKQVFSGGISG